MAKQKGKNIVFLGSKSIGFHCLKHLIEHQEDLNVTILGVLSNDRNIGGDQVSITQLCNEHEIKMIDHPDDLLLMDNIDFLISVQYHLILSKEQLAMANEAAINLHMAPLPEYRGCNQFSFAIIDQKEEFGTTLHIMEPGIDNGDIIAEKRFPISSNIQVKELYEKTLQASKELFEDSIERIVNDNYSTTPQSSYTSFRTSSFHTRSEINEIKKIDLNWPKEKIDRYIRATYFPPFAPPYTIIEGRKVELTHNWQEELK